ncbi:HNH endonuclease [Rhizobium grahamii]|uniref:HNH endonuclease n=1 Tax=Rhizobium grahamii CCGE 502 TaxID=990285 RepID=S3HIM3_9HYPH|nr:HNH endonuclease [Rhizobium grahamii]EPE98602.1 hypothetical protein RGCCGE502_09255 [Rhizobium grahamii CCGE 502]
MNDYRSEEARKWQRLYKTSAWRKLRHYQLSIEPLCRFCIEAEEVTAAEVVDHIHNHKGDLALFHDPYNLQSLCRPHHDGTKQRLDRGAVDTRLDGDGWPEWRNGH